MLQEFGDKNLNNDYPHGLRIDWKEGREHTFWGHRNTVDPWTTQVSTAQVYLHLDFFQQSHWKISWSFATI